MDTKNRKKKETREIDTREGEKVRKGERDGRK